MEIFFIFLFLLINFLYIKTWTKFLDKVPSGIGILLTIPCFFYFQQNLNSISILLILVFSFLYFLDDIIEINFLWRILLQIFASLVIYFSFTSQIDFTIFISTLLAFIILVNTLNFQDGEDLNIGVLLILIFGNFYFNTDDKLTQYTSQLILFFLISFSFFNIKKKLLYFGDSSCYFISIIIFIFAYNEIQNAILIKTLIAVISFPIIDVFYVIIYRIIKRQNLLSRNYLHLYQILAQKINSKFYLLPNIFFSFLNILFSFNFVLGPNFIMFLIILNVILLIAIRLTIKKYLI